MRLSCYNFPVKTDNGTACSHTRDAQLPGRETLASALGKNVTVIEIISAFATYSSACENGSWHWDYCCNSSLRLLLSAYHSISCKHKYSLNWVSCGCPYLETQRLLSELFKIVKIVSTKSSLDWHVWKVFGYLEVSKFYRYYSDSVVLSWVSIYIYLSIYMMEVISKILTTSYIIFSDEQ